VPLHWLSVQQDVPHRPRTQTPSRHSSLLPQGAPAAARGDAVLQRPSQALPAVMYWQRSPAGHTADDSHGSPQL